jgi:hypothetical protein
LTGESDSKSEGADNGEGCASNQQKINGEYKTAHAIQHGTSHHFQFQTIVFATGFPSIGEKSEPLPLRKVLAQKESQTRWCLAEHFDDLATPRIQLLKRSELFQRGGGASDEYPMKNQRDGGSVEQEYGHSVSLSTTGKWYSA